MRRSTVAAVLGLVLLAGCNGVSGGTDVSGAGGETVTPAPVPTAEPTATPGPRLAPGLHAGGVENATALGRAHNRSLAATPFTRRTTITIRFANGTRFARVVRVTRVGVDRADFRHTTRVSGALVPSHGEGGRDVMEQTVRSDGGRVVQSHALANGSTLHPDISSEEGALLRRFFTRTGGERVTRLFTEIETTVAGHRTRDGTTVYRVDAPTVPSDRLPYADRFSPRNARVRAIVDARGLVHEYRLTARGEMDGQPVLVEAVTRYEPLGDTPRDGPAPAGGPGANRTGSG